MARIRLSLRSYRNDRVTKMEKDGVKRDREAWIAPVVRQLTPEEVRALGCDLDALFAEALARRTSKLPRA